jgi:hypothetical protein
MMLRNRIVWLKYLDVVTVALSKIKILSYYFMCYANNNNKNNNNNNRRLQRTDNLPSVGIEICIIKQGSIYQPVFKPVAYALL